MATNYIKDTEGKVQVVETEVKATVKDLHEMKERKAYLDESITNRKQLFVVQKAYELAQAEKQMDEELLIMQAEADQLALDIEGAITAGVVEVIPPPEPEPVPEEPIV